MEQIGYKFVDRTGASESTSELPSVSNRRPVDTVFAECASTRNVLSVGSPTYVT